MKKNVFILSAVLCLLAGCGQKQQEPFVRSVMLSQPERLEATRVKTFSGVVREAGEISLGFKTAGQIASLAVKEGDYVRKGQLVATLDDADYKLGVEALQVQYDQLSDEVARLKKLYEAKNVSVNDYEKAVAGLKQLGVQLQVNRNKLDYTRLYAPVGGYVQGVNFEEAEMVDAGTPVITLLDTRRMEVELDLPVSVYMQRERLESVSCRPFFDEGGTQLPMQVLSIVPKADGNQLYKMRLVFEGAMDKRLTAGMNIEVSLKIVGGDGGGKFVLPLHAVFQDQGEACVWTLGKDSTVHKARVEVEGIDPVGRAIVTSGLSGSEQVVKAGVHLLQEGEKVKVIDEAASGTNVGGLI